MQVYYLFKICNVSQLKIVDADWLAKYIMINKKLMRGRQRLVCVLKLFHVKQRGTAPHVLAR